MEAADGGFTGDVLVVDWIDSIISSPWQDRKEFLEEGKEAGVCRTVGFLLKDEDGWLTLAQSWTKDDSVAGKMIIPQVAITRVQRLEAGE